MAVGVVALDAVAEPDHVGSPRAARRGASRAPSLETPGLRFGSSRVGSVASRVPSPSTSSAPPSVTSAIRSRATPASDATRAATASSRSQGAYFPPHALKVQSSATRPCAPSRTKVGAMSRIQTSSVGITCRRTAPERASSPSRARSAAACASLCATSSTRSERASARTSVSNSRSASARQPGQVVSACGQATHVAACGSHSAGMRSARTSAPEAGEQVGVGVDPAIAQERPAAALRLDPREVAVDHAASPRPSHSPAR